MADATDTDRPSVRRWQPLELNVRVPAEVIAGVGNPYVELAVDVEWTHRPSGRTLSRPAFWDGVGFRVRFASPEAEGVWTWAARVNGERTDVGGEVDVVDGEPADAFERHGPLRMSDDGRSVVHHDGRAFLVVADTPWALPFRATPQTCRVYAADRQAKGFNAALLMVVQPDMRAKGPTDRTADAGFGRAFADLPAGRLTQPLPDYFDTLDQLLDILLAHGIVPVFQPVFQGFGWKGQGVAGNVVPPEDYAWFCRYLVARYGHRPAVWLVGGDGSGDEPQVPAGGAMIHAVDAFAQPTGIHYGPNQLPDAHHTADWLDFQWCQTGHAGHHLPDRVRWLWDRTPAKACANGEPTYERPDRGAGMWQAHEAWSNLCAGGTMGVVYGAMSLWQWRHHRDEPGWPENFTAPGCGWRDALDFPGSTHVGNVARILGGYDTTGLAPDWTFTWGRPGLLNPGKLAVVYLHDGGGDQVLCGDVPREYTVFRTSDAEPVARSRLDAHPVTPPYPKFEAPAGPHVVVFGTPRAG